MTLQLDHRGWTAAQHVAACVICHQATILLFPRGKPCHWTRAQAWSASTRTTSTQDRQRDRRILAAYARRVASEDVDALAQMTALAAELDEAIGRALTGLRLGITRQAAQPTSRVGDIEPDQRPAQRPGIIHRGALRGGRTDQEETEAAVRWGSRADETLPHAAKTMQPAATASTNAQEGCTDRLIEASSGCRTTALTGRETVTYG